MFLALREMRRSLGRFVLLGSAVALLVFLILFQQALRDGLVTAFIGAVRNQHSEVIVYSVEGQRTLQGSSLTEQQVDAITRLPEVGRAARMSVATYTVRVGRGELSDATLIASDDPTLVRPHTLSGGRWARGDLEVVGSDAEFAPGDTVEVVAAAGATPVQLEVVGVASDVQLAVTPTLFGSTGAAFAARRAVTPQARGVQTNAVAVEPAPGVTAERVADEVNRAVADTDALTRQTAADETPGVAEVRQSFRILFLLYALVVPLVTGLFFLILTLQKAASLTLLRAMGARSSTLARSLLIQVGAVLAVGIGVGTLAFAPLSQQRLGGLSLHFNTRAVLLWATLLATLGVASAAASLRRVLAADPIEATQGGADR